MNAKKKAEGKRIQIKINELIKNINTTNTIMQELGLPEKVLERKIKPFGNAGHITLPKEYLDKKVKIVVGK